MSNSIVRGDDYLKLPRSPDTWLVENLLPTSGSMLVFGDPKVGKSYAALQLSCCLTSGTEWLGFGVPKAVPVVYVQLDTPRSLWAKRIEELSSSGHPVEGVHFADRETLNTHPFDILREEHFKLLSESLAELRPGAVVIDTLRESHSGDENDSTEMQDVIAHLDAAVKPSAMILVSHARKSNPQIDHNLMNDNRGSNYIVGRMDSICRFWKSSMRLTSRTMEEHSIKIQRQDDGTWTLEADPFRQALLDVRSTNSHLSLREQARILHERVPSKTEEACRAALRRLGH